MYCNNEYYFVFYLETFEVHILFQNLDLSSKVLKRKFKKEQHSVADPGFSPGGCANFQNCYYFSNFCRKLHENERIWTPGGGGGARPWPPPLDPPMALILVFETNAMPV